MRFSVLLGFRNVEHRKWGNFVQVFHLSLFVEQMDATTRREISAQPESVICHENFFKLRTKGKTFKKNLIFFSPNEILSRLYYTLGLFHKKVATKRATETFTMNSKLHVRIPLAFRFQKFNLWVWKTGIENYFCFPLVSRTPRCDSWKEHNNSKIGISLDFW